VPALEKLIVEWVRVVEEPKRQRLADEAQRIALDEVTYVPWGQWAQPTAFRRSVRDVLKFAAPIFWNVKLE
jgi:peptide/nickel transport system substrate-binding protein